MSGCYANIRRIANLSNDSCTSTASAVGGFEVLFPVCPGFEINATAPENGPAVFQRRVDDPVVVHSKTQVQNIEYETCSLVQISENLNRLLAACIEITLAVIESNQQAIQGILDVIKDAKFADEAVDSVYQQSYETYLIALNAFLETARQGPAVSATHREVVGKIQDLALQADSFSAHVRQEVTTVKQTLEEILALMQKVTRSELTRTVLTRDFLSRALGQLDGLEWALRCQCATGSASVEWSEVVVAQAEHLFLQLQHALQPLTEWVQSLLDSRLLSPSLQHYCLVVLRGCECFANAQIRLKKQTHNLASTEIGLS